MTKEKARDLLREWLDKRSEQGQDLPIYDEVVYQKETFGTPTTFEQYTFRYLIKLAYDMQDS